MHKSENLLFLPFRIILMNCVLPYLGEKPKDMLDFKDMPHKGTSHIGLQLLSLQLLDFSFMSSSINILQYHTWHCKMCLSTCVP